MSLPIAEENNTAFVSMPFQQPFIDRFSTFYQPLLAKLGYRSFRAWGGLALENYWDLLLVLIQKSDIIFAELTTLNPNVMHEVGIAEGMGKTVLMVAERDSFESPSNLNYHAIVGYDPKGSTWTGGVIADTARIMWAGICGMRKRLRKAQHTQR